MYVLSFTSGVSLRMVQLYEQRQNDISKAQAAVVLSLARALGCNIEDILDWINHKLNNSDVVSLSSLNGVFVFFNDKIATYETFSSSYPSDYRYC